jgi:GT2 family glycosyltransferase
MNLSHEMSFSIVILTYNRKELLNRLLCSIEEIHWSSLETIVVDNCSTDGTQDMFPVLFPKVSYIRMDRNMGVGARNSGMEAAHGEFLITMDDDVIGISEKDLLILQEIFKDRPNVGAVNFKVINPTDGSLCNWVHHCPSEVFHDKEFLTYEITEGAVAFRKKTLEITGYYPLNYFISHEGPDLALRFYESGSHVMYTGRICVQHFHASEGRTPWRNYYYDTRNQFLLVYRNFPMRYGIQYLTRGLGAMLLYSLRDGYMKYWLKGIVDGIRMTWDSKDQRKILSDKTMHIINDIDSNRPGIWYLLRKRVFRRSVAENLN